MEEALKEQEKLDASGELDARAALILNPDTPFGDCFEAVMTDLLAGRHISQTEPSDENLLHKPTDEGEDEDKPTEEY